MINWDPRPRSRNGQGFWWNHHDVAPDPCGTSKRPRRVTNQSFPFFLSFFSFSFFCSFPECCLVAYLCMFHSTRLPTKPQHWTRSPRELDRGALRNEAIHLTTRSSLPEKPRPFCFDASSLHRFPGFVGSVFCLRRTRRPRVASGVDLAGDCKRFLTGEAKSF